MAKVDILNPAMFPQFVDQLAEGVLGLAYQSRDRLEFTLVAIMATQENKLLELHPEVCLCLTTFTLNTLKFLHLKCWCIFMALM